MTSLHPEPKEIPIPKNFPLKWDHPGQIHLPWMQDRMHAPEPITPLSGWLSKYPWTDGSNRGFYEVDQPVKFDMARFNTYYYAAISPRVPPEDMEQASAAAENTLKELIPTFADRWDNEWLPEVKTILGWFSDFDYEAASDSELLEHVNGSFEKFARLWDIHFQVAPPFLGAPSMFADLYADLFDPKDGLEAFDLLHADHNMSLEVGYALWDLSQKYKDHTPILDILQSSSTEEALGKLSTIDAGNNFLDELAGLLDRYGHRADGVLEIGVPSWTEDPTPAIATIRENMGPNGEDPRATHARLIERRDAAVRRAREALDTYPQPVKDQFELLLAAGQNGGRIQEDHNFWIDQNGLHYMRQMFRECGRRMEEKGCIDTANDVVYLVPEQIKEAFDQGTDYRSLVRKEKEEMARWAEVAPPTFIGTDYGHPPSNPFSKAIDRFWGTPPEQSSDPNLISGIPVSAGVVTGTARKVMRISDGHRLKQGEILVTPTTAPPWTPLFGVASAVVTDVGGPLSHCGIVSREYGIPCVGGTTIGTTTIQDGQQIEVDGNAGTVRIL